MTEVLLYDFESASLYNVVPNDKVKADTNDPTANYLDGKVDTTTIDVNTSTHKIKIADDYKTNLDIAIALALKLDNGVVSLGAGTQTVNLNITMSSSTYTVILSCYNLVDGGMIFPSLTTQTTTTFTVDLPDSCNLHYIVIGI